MKLFSRKKENKISGGGGGGGGFMGDDKNQKHEQSKSKKKKKKKTVSTKANHNSSNKTLLESRSVYTDGNSTSYPDDVKKCFSAYDHVENNENEGSIKDILNHEQFPITTPPPTSQHHHHPHLSTSGDGTVGTAATQPETPTVTPTSSGIALSPTGLSKRDEALEVRPKMQLTIPTKQQRQGKGGKGQRNGERDKNESKEKIKLEKIRTSSGIALSPTGLSKRDEPLEVRPKMQLTIPTKQQKQIHGERVSNESKDMIKRENIGKDQRHDGDVGPLNLNDHLQREEKGDSMVPNRDERSGGGRKSKQPGPGEVGSGYALARSTYGNGRNVNDNDRISIPIKIEQINRLKTLGRIHYEQSKLVSGGVETADSGAVSPAPAPPPWEETASVQSSSPSESPSLQASKQLSESGRSKTTADLPPQMNAATTAKKSEEVNSGGATVTAASAGLTEKNRKINKDGVSSELHEKSYRGEKKATLSLYSSSSSASSKSSWQNANSDAVKMATMVPLKQDILRSAASAKGGGIGGEEGGRGRYQSQKEQVHLKQEQQQQIQQRARQQRSPLTRPHIQESNVCQRNGQLEQQQQHSIFDVEEEFEENHNEEAGKTNKTRSETDNDDEGTSQYDDDEIDDDYEDDEFYDDDEDYDDDVDDHEGSIVSASSGEIIMPHTLRRRQRRGSSPANVEWVRQVLDRPYGRDYIPANAKRWQVEVGAPEYDDLVGQWNYTIFLQQNSIEDKDGADDDDDDLLYNNDNNEDDVLLPNKSYHVTRTLQDVKWLESALTYEYSGSLVLPVLSCYYKNQFNQKENKHYNGIKDVGDVENEEVIEHYALAIQHWFYDVLNGIRGNGEVILGHDLVGAKELMKSESMETFLFQVGALPPPERFQQNNNLSSLQDAKKNQQQQRHQQESSSAAANGRKSQNAPSDVFFRMFACFDPNAMDGGVNGLGQNGRNQQEQNQPRTPSSFDIVPTLFASAASSPREGGGDVIDNVGNHANVNPRAVPKREDSYMSSSMTPNSSQLAIHSEIIESYRLYSKNIQKCILPKCYKYTAILLHYETIHGAAWKRLAIALSNLFGLEREIMDCKISSPTTTSQSDRRYNFNNNALLKRIKKSDMEDVLRLLTKCKMERGLVGPRLLKSMMLGYQQDMVYSTSRSLISYLRIASERLSLPSSGGAVTVEDRNDAAATARVGGGGRLLMGSGGSVASFGGGGGGGFSSGASVSSDSTEMMKQYVNMAAQKFDTVRRQLYPPTTTSPSVVVGNATSNDVTSQNQQQQQRETMNNILCERVITHERRLHASLGKLCASTPIRMSRMSYAYFKTEAEMASQLSTASVSIRTKVLVPNNDDEVSSSHANKVRLNKIAEEGKVDDATELRLVQQILDLANVVENDNVVGGGTPLFPATGTDSESGAVSKSAIIDKQRMQELRRNEAMQITKQNVGRWNSHVAMVIMEAVGVPDAQVRIEETSHELRQIRKFAICLRESVERCQNAVEAVLAVVYGDEETYSMDRDDGAQDYYDEANPRSSTQAERPIPIHQARKDFISAISFLFSGVFIDCDENDDFGTKNRRPLLPNRHHSSRKSSSSSPSKPILSSAGIDTSDPAGWLNTSSSSSLLKGNDYDEEQDVYHNDEDDGKCGKYTMEYVNIRDVQIQTFLDNLHITLQKYILDRVETLESCVYMNCVGIHLERHYSQLRADSLAAWEKKTDITTAINIATRKRLPVLVKELEDKLHALSSTVSHTSVKRAKERHLSSKSIKQELSNLALRKFARIKETSLDFITTMIGDWAKHEEQCAALEIKTLIEIIDEITRNVTEEDIAADGGAHLFV